MAETRDEQKVAHVVTTGDSTDSRTASAVAPDSHACAICGKPASCYGVYEHPDDPIQFACDDCCGHGNEDGWCRPVEHDADICGCENHAPWCPYNLRATEVAPYALRPPEAREAQAIDLTPLVSGDGDPEEPTGVTHG